MKATQSTLRKNLTKIKEHGKGHQSIKLGTLGGHNPLCLKSYKIRYPMKNFKHPKLPSFFLLKWKTVYSDHPNRRAACFF